MIRRASIIFCFIYFSFSVSGQEKTSKEIKFEGEVKLNNQSLSGVKLELKKNGEVVKTIKSSSSGDYVLLIDINTTNSEDADYVLTFTKNKMLPKTVSINTYIEKPTARSYIFNLDVDMMEQKEDDIVIDLPSANIRWSEDDRKFIFDQTHAKTIKKIKEEEEARKKEVVKPNKPVQKTKVESNTSPQDIPVSVLDEERKKQIQDSLIKKYQKGITEEIFQEASYSLIKRTVVINNQVVIYYKKAWNWGGVFYFKEEQSTVRSISENTYNLETVGVK